MRYIAIVETLQKVFFWIGVGGGGLLFLVGLWASIQILDVSFLRFLGMLAGTVIATAFYFLFLWLSFIFAMASTELIRVVVDVENNTRN